MDSPRDQNSNDVNYWIDRRQRLQQQITLAHKERNNLAYNYGNEIKTLSTHLDQCRSDAALVVHALNCAVQLIEALIAFTPEGTSLSPQVSTAKGALDQAMAAITGRSQSI